MDFGPEPGRARGESVVAMINVVFLLLVFFLMAARIEPPAPFEVDPPPARTGTPPAGEATVWLAADGRVAFEAQRGQPAIAAAAAAAGDGTLVVRADRASTGVALAGLLADLAAAGAGRIEIATVGE